MRRTNHLYQSVVAERKSAIERGLEFVYRNACEPENFEAYGFDYLGCFQGIEATSKDMNLRRTARRMGRERARHWRREYGHITADVDADQIAYLVFGSYSADRLGVRDTAFKK